MVGFPHDYGDSLSVDKAKENRKLFFKKYGRVVIINGALFLLTKNAQAQNNVPEVPKGVEAPKPSPSPVFRPILPPSRIIGSKVWTGSGVLAISWICITAAATGDPTLLVACGSLVAYAIGQKP